MQRGPAVSHPGALPEAQIFYKAHKRQVYNNPPTPPQKTKAVQKGGGGGIRCCFLFPSIIMELVKNLITSSFKDILNSC